MNDGYSCHPDPPAGGEGSLLVRALRDSCATAEALAARGRFTQNDNMDMGEFCLPASGGAAFKYYSSAFYD